MSNMSPPRATNAEPVSWTVSLPPVTIAESNSAEASSTPLSLDNIPGELRNEIIKLVVVFPDALKIAVCPRDGKVHLFHQMFDGNQELFESGDLHLTTRQRTGFDEHDLAAMEYVEVYVPALALAHIYRQFHREILSIFLCENSFMFKELDGPLYPVPTPWGVHDHKGSGVLAYGDWTKIIGTSFSTVVLKKVVIDVASIHSMSRAQCLWKNAFDTAPNSNLGIYNADNILDVTPLILAHWGSDRPFNLSIVEQTSWNTSQGSPFPNRSWLGQNNTSRLEELVMRLVCDEDLRLKKSRKLIGRIGIHRDIMELPVPETDYNYNKCLGFIIFNTTGDRCSASSMAKHLPDSPCSTLEAYSWGDQRHGHSTRYRRYPHTMQGFWSVNAKLKCRSLQPSVGKISHLPECVLRRVLEHLMCLPIHMDTKEFHRQSPREIPTVTQILDRNVPGLWEAIPSIELTCTSTEKSFSAFDSLFRWTHVAELGSRHYRGEANDADRFPGVEEHLREIPSFTLRCRPRQQKIWERVSAVSHFVQILNKVKGLRIKLQFCLDGVAFLKDVQINISNFIFSTARINNRVNGNDVQIDIVVYTKGDGAHWRMAGDALDAIFRRSRSDEGMPEAACRTEEYYPNIWMNGLGEISVRSSEYSKLNRHGYCVRRFSTQAMFRYLNHVNQGGSAMEYGEEYPKAPDVPFGLTRFRLPCNCQDIS